ncbi:MAG: TRAP transporter small permease subunit [Bacteroidota bacterium]
MKKRITQLLQIGTMISTIGFVGSVLIQIFARFVLSNTPPWTEAASRLCFIYAISFAAGLALKDQYYVYLDVFFSRFSKKVQSLLERLIPLLIFFLFGLLAIFAVPFVQQGWQEQSPSMQIPMAWAFGSMLVLGLSIAYYSLLLFLQTFQSSDV